MGILNKDTGIAAPVLGASDLGLRRDLGSAFGYGGSALASGGVVISQRWHGLNETIMGGGTAPCPIVEPSAHPNQAPAVRRSVLAPYPERPPV